jgi:hypothetical protein
MTTPTLRQFFRHQLAREFQSCGLAEPQALDYVSDVLSRFARTSALYALRDDDGRSLEYLVDMRAAHCRASRERAREILRHIGEYALFMSGLFRERIDARGELEYYFAEGAGAYSGCAEREPNPAHRQLYRRVCHQFRAISGALDHVRREQWPLAAPVPTPTRDTLLESLWRR